ncbi:MAG: histidine kinase, partial [Thermomicrobiales bacterium]
LAVTAVVIVVFGAVIGTISGSVAARQLTVRLDRVSDAASAWGAGDFSAAVADRSEDELGQLGRRLNRMVEQLADLIRAREQLSVVDERNRLARDLHDSVKQQAFAVSMHLGSARELWERDPGTARERLDAAYEIARQSQQELTAIIQTLRPIELADATFERALRDHLAQWQTRTGIVVDAQIAADAPLPHPVEDALFRVAQEALTNVARQSRASRVRVGFARGGDSAMLEIADDGTGFEVRRTRPGMGMQSMRERMESLGGTFALGSDAGGTRIDVRLPLKETGGM